MNRVSEAMRRAGELKDERTATGEELPFVVAEGPAVVPPPPPHTVPRVVRTGAAPSGVLVRRERIAAIEPVRSDAGEDVRIVDVIRILYGRRWLMAFVILAALGGAIAYNQTTTPIYEARARLLLESNSPEVVPFRTVTEDQGRLDYYTTQLEVLRSRALIRRTLEQLNMLDPDPKRQSDQVGRLLGALTVVPAKSDMGETRVINLSFRNPNPEFAARVANGIAQTYVDQNLDSRRQGSRDAFEWLTQRLNDLRGEVNTREEALQRYRQQKDSVSLGDQQNIVVQKLAQLNAAVTSARTERVEREALYQQLVAIRESGAPLDTFSPILANSFIQGLKGELATLQREREQLTERLGDLHPDMIKVNTSIANVERQLQGEMAKVVEGIQNEYRAAVAQEQGLTQALEEQKREVLDLSQQSIGYTALQRDAASTQQMLEAVRQRVKETELAGELQSNNAKILDAAEVPGQPVWPRTELIVIIAFLGGTFLAVALALGVDYLNPRLAKPSDIADALGLPLLGIAPQIARLKNRTAAFNDLPPMFQQAIRGIRTRILLSPNLAAAPSIAVTSTIPQEGKTVVACNLAVSMAMAGRRVLLVDADLHRPQVHRLFNVARSPGLSEIMAGDTKPSETLRESTTPGLFILAAGAEAASPTDLLDSDRLHDLIEGLSEVFDVVVLDCPPVMAVADASIIGHAASSVLFVVGSGTTSREAAQVALDRLAAVQVQVVGVVLNKAKDQLRSNYGYEAALGEDIA